MKTNYTSDSDFYCEICRSILIEPQQQQPKTDIKVYNLHQTMPAYTCMKEY